MKTYPVGLVGESNYQAAIEQTHPGELAKICHEVGNPFDDKALRVENNIGQVIGYIPRASWLHRAVHEDGNGLAAVIKAVSRPHEGAYFGVVLDVTLTDDTLFERHYDGPAKKRRSRRLKPKESAPPPEAIERATNFARRLLSMITVPFNCDCGETFSLAYRGLSAGTAVRCPACSNRSTIDLPTLERLDSEFAQLAEQSLSSQRLPALSVEAIATLREDTETDMV